MICFQSSMLSLVHNMSRSNATRCDWLCARCLVPRQPRSCLFTILENSSRCAASRGDSALFILWYSFNSSEDIRETVYIQIWPYTYGVEGFTSPKKRLGARNISKTVSTRGVPITFCKKCACSTSKLSATTRKQAHSFNELLLSPFYAAEFFIACITGHVKRKCG